MTGEFPLVFPVLISGAAVAVLLLAVGMLRSWRALQVQNRAQLETAQAQILHAMNDNHSRLTALIERHATSHQSSQNDIVRNVEAIQADLEWMAGEKMIEQAMDLVRENMPVSQIAQETGLSADKIRTITAFRTH
jgi:hypothetical protein